jgi:hypothetical protein
MMRKLFCLLALVTVLAAQTATTQPASAGKKAAGPVVSINSQTSPIYAYDYGNPWDDESGPYAPATWVTATVKCEAPGVLYHNRRGSLTQNGVAYPLEEYTSLGWYEVECGSDGMATFGAGFYSDDMHPGPAVARLTLYLPNSERTVTAKRTVRIPRS